MNIYDTLPYPVYAFPQSHPGHLATVAALFGLEPADPRSSRVLELGCASGGNLIPMAEACPAGTFVGIDGSPRQIADGQGVVDALQLTNIKLLNRLIDDVDFDLGDFDYVICHGVFSWVSAAVREKILKVCSRCLAPAGIAYVSYNTLPGWHMRRMVRDVMSFHASKFEDVATRIEQARAVLQFLGSAVPAESGAYGALLHAELKQVARANDSYLFHEFLEEDNEPLYFQDFVRQAEGAGLQYLAESDVGSMWIGNFPAEVAASLHRLGRSVVEREQYMDFVRNRSFRQTLLCRQGLAIERRVQPQRLRGMYAAANLKPADEQQDQENREPDDRDGVRFEEPDGRGITTSDVLLQTALCLLREIWPRAMAVDDLCAASQERLTAAGESIDGETDEILDRLAGGLQVCHASGVCELRRDRDLFTTIVAERPTARPLARFQGERGSVVTNLRHELVELPELDRAVLTLLDGTRNRDAVVAEIVRLAAHGADLSEAAGGQASETATGEGVSIADVDDGILRIATLSLLSN